MKKRFLSAMLVISMLLTMLPNAVFALGQNPFIDIETNSWYYEDVNFVTDNGYFYGVSDTEFDPEGTMTRAMFVTVIARYCEAQVDNTVSSFNDIPADTWYTGSVTWAAENDIVAGIGDGNFDPDSPVTREQMSAIIDRFVSWYQTEHNVRHRADGTAVTFPDESDISAYASEAVDNCQIYGLIYGFDDGMFYPDNSSTRAQVAAIIHRIEWISDAAPTLTPSASAEPKGYTVTLYNQDEVYATATVEPGKTYKIPANPKRTGYTFQGWSETKDGQVNSEYKSGKEITVNGDLTLYAVWKAAGGGGGGGGGGHKPTVTASPTPSVTPSPSPSASPSPSPAADRTLTLDLNFEGGTKTTRTVTEAENFEYTLEESDKPTRDGYTFAGWADTKDATEAEYNAGDKVEVAESGTTIYAVWEFTVTLHLNYEEDEADIWDTYTGLAGTEYSIKENPVREGYTFLGWSATEEGTPDNQYIAGAEITANLDLYAQWSKNGALTLESGNYGSYGENESKECTPTEGKYTLTDADMPTVTDPYAKFGGWIDPTDTTETVYNVGDVVEVPEEGKTLYAVWKVDYIGKAVAATAGWADSEIDTKVNAGVGALIGFINDDLIKKLPDEQQELVEFNYDEDNPPFKLEINYDTVNAPTKTEQGARTVNVTIDAKTTTPSTLALSEFAIRYAMLMIDSTQPDYDANSAKQVIKEMIADVINGMELEDVENLTTDTVTKAKLEELVNELAADYIAGFKDNWRNLAGNGICITNMLATAGDTTIADAHVGDITKDDVKNAIMTLLQELKNDAANQTKWTNALSLNVPVKVVFTPAESIEDSYYTEETADEDLFPTEYKVNFTVNAESADSAVGAQDHYLEYKFDQTKKESFIKVILPEKVKTAYDSKVPAKLDELIKSNTVTTKLQSVIDSAKGDFENQLTSKVDAMSQDFGIDVSGIKTTLNENISNWLIANNLTGAGLTNSFVYKRMTGEVPNAEPENNTSLMEVVDGVVLALRTKLNNEIESAPGNTIPWTVETGIPLMPSVTVQIKVDDTMNVQKIINNAIAGAEPGQLSSAIDGVIDTFKAAVNAKTSEELEQMAIDSLDPTTASMARDKIKGKGDKIKQEMLSHAEEKLSAVTTLSSKLKEFETDDNNMIKALIKYLEASLIDAKAGNGGTNAEQTRPALIAAVADTIYNKVGAYKPAVDLLQKFKSFDNVWNMHLNGITTQMTENKDLVMQVIDADLWTTVSDYVEKAQTALENGKIGNTSIPMWNRLQKVTLTIDDGSSDDPTPIDVASLKEDLTGLKTAVDNAKTAAETLAGDSTNTDYQTAYSEAYDAVVNALQDILNKYSIGNLSLSSFADCSDAGNPNIDGVLITGTYNNHELSFYLVLERGWLEAPAGTIFPEATGSSVLPETSAVPAAPIE